MIYRQFTYIQTCFDRYRILLQYVATLKLTTCRPVSVYTRAYLLKFDCETSNTAYENRARIRSWNQPVLRSFVCEELRSSQFVSCSNKKSNSCKQSKFTVHSRVNALN